MSSRFRIKLWCFGFRLLFSVFLFICSVLGFLAVVGFVLVSFWEYQSVLIFLFVFLIGYCIYIILIFCRGFVSSLFCFFLFFLHVAKLSSSGSLHAFTSERDPCRDRLVGEAVRLTSQKSKY